MTDQPYPYDDAWKAQVDRAGAEWMAYCEAVSEIKRYLRTRLTFGREVAVEEFDARCEALAKNNSRGAARVERVRADFRLIWAHERERLTAEVQAEEEVAQAA